MGLQNVIPWWLKSHCECATTQDLKAMEARIVMTNKELETALNNQTTQIGKIAKEQNDRFVVLTKEVADLTDKINAGDVTPEVAAALVSTQAALDSLDAAIPDAPVTP